MVGTPTGGIRRMELADHHASVATIELPANAPADLVSMFDRARHVFLYAWFDYELTPLAALQALTTLERALKQFYGAGKSGLRQLAERAVSDGRFPAVLGAAPLPLVLAEFRNHWAHGSDHFGTPNMALDVLELCAELIGKLCPPTP